MKNIILIIVIVLLVIIAGVTGFFVFKYYQDNNSLKSEVTQLKAENDLLNTDLKNTKEQVDNLNKRVNELTKVPENYIKIISPNGGETLCLNSNTTIKWESKGIDRIGIRIIKETIDGTNYYNISGFDSISATAGKTGIPGEGTISWNVKNILAGDSYKIEITSIDTNKTKVVSKSEKVFSISYCQ